MENCIKRLDKVRNHIINQMQILTSYTDVLQIYEYVLNRVEYRFVENINDSSIEDITKDIKKYIFESNDNVITNYRIKEIIGQLPVRMTRSKFYEILHESLNIYMNTEESALDTYLYILKTGAMLYTPDGMDTAYYRLKLFRKELETFDYKNISKEEYSRLSAKMEEEADFINTLSNFYCSMMEVINPLYAVVLMDPYSYMDGSPMNVISSKDEGVLDSIIKDIIDHFTLFEKTDLPIETEEKLSYTEGKQELILDELCQLEPVFYEIKENYKSKINSLMLGPLYYSLDVSQKLLGNSLFAELDIDENNKKVNEHYIRQSEEELFTKLTELFDKSPKVVIRAVMANIISKMPVFFETKNDVMEYVAYTLEQCKDLAEKTASIKIIKSFWDN
jgi:hypothetical protein